MHITSVEIENIKSIQKLRWEVPAGQEAGWHVIIGDNGSGKTTFLQAVAMGLIGAQIAGQLRQNWSKWVTNKSTLGLVHLKVDIFKSKMGVLFDSDKNVVTDEYLKLGGILPNKIGSISSLTPSALLGTTTNDFSISFGAFRRFTGQKISEENFFESFPKLGRHLSIFEDVALGRTLGWLQNLQFKRLEKHPEGELLENIKLLLNQKDSLPYKVRMGEVTSDGVNFVDANGCDLRVEDLSAGYHSILSLTFELIRQLSILPHTDSIFDKTDPSKIIVPGVVLIDEIDAHLHPTWQRKIGQWFRKYFPNMQFIVTTHSPLICQAAEHGTVFRLPRPGTDETGRMIVGDELNRLVYGNVLDAYGTELFGENVTRSESSEKKLQQLAELNRKEIRKGLTERERKKQQSLRRMLPTTAYETNGVKE